MKSPQAVHLLCGVPGSGKTWICRQLEGRFCYVPHDDYKTGEYGDIVIAMAKMAARPVLAEAPFRMSLLWRELEDAGLKVHAYFIKEPMELIISRYEAREGKPIPKQHLTNYHRLLRENRAWFVGNQKEILEMLKQV